jgi:hypothetical protein
VTGIVIAQQHGPTEHPDENVVRRNTFEVNRADPPAEADSAPDMSEVITDPNPKLGMTSRQKASAWTPTIRTPPFWARRATAPHDSIVNDRRASQGFSPAREADGITGHGSYAFAEGIEPVGDLTRAGGMTNEYFAAHRPGIQPTAGEYMLPNADLVGAKMQAAVGATNARDAYQSSAAYGGFLAAMIGG